ncbi:MAG: hypothetical protein KAS53_00625 [Candidatus Cloacimonetes bacterium]|nr:hypothetical protein [Candidatus Cloacimonadota bacterium]
MDNNYIKLYEEVCRTYHNIHSFRAKLLALLPFASGFCNVILLLNTNKLNTYLFPIGIFGAIVTFGLFIYELRGTQRCYELKKIAINLEKTLKLSKDTGQFLGEPKPILGFIREGIAGAIIYASVFCGWILISTLS